MFRRYCQPQVSTVSQLTDSSGSTDCGRLRHEMGTSWVCCQLALWSVPSWHLCVCLCAGGIRSAHVIAANWQRANWSKLLQYNVRQCSPDNVHAFLSSAICGAPAHIWESLWNSSSCNSKHEFRLLTFHCTTTHLADRGMALHCVVADYRELRMEEATYRRPHYPSYPRCPVSLRGFTIVS